MKFMLKLFTIAVTVALLSSCSGIKVTADYDTTTDFTKYKTIEYYGWAKESDKVLNGLDKVRIEDSFAKEFADRGLSLVKDNGDLIVTLFVVVEQKTQQTANTTTMGGYYGGYYGYGPGWGWGPGHTTTTISEYNYKEGTLVCDVFDKATEKLIWEGIANKTIEDNPQKREKTIPYTIAKMMMKYPVPPVKKK